MRGRKLWMRLQAHGATVAVYVVKHIVNEGVECDGIFYPDRNIIEIETRDNEAAMKMRLLHEILHVCFAAHTADALDQVLKDDNRDDRASHEEHIVGFLEPILYSILAPSGCLKFPRPPRLT